MCSVLFARPLLTRLLSFFMDHRLNILDWPVNSPDLNTIEDLWGSHVDNDYKMGGGIALSMTSKMQLCFRREILQTCYAVNS